MRFLFLVFLPAICLGQLNYTSIRDYSYPLRLYCGSEYQMSASGFFINYNNKYYLVSNYHVFAGIDPITNRSVDSMPCIPDSVGVGVLQPGKIVFKKYPLLTKGKALYRFIGNGVIDVSALPVNINTFAGAINTFKLDDLDTSINIGNGQKVSCVGYPESCLNNQFSGQPCVFTAETEPCKDDSGLFGNLCFNVGIGFGGSGSPVFKMGKPGEDFKLIAIHSRGSIYKNRSSSVYIKYLMDIIKSSK